MSAMSPEEQPLTQRLQGDGAPPARRQARWAWLIVGALGVACLLGGLRQRFGSAAASVENLRGAVGLQYAPAYGQAPPPAGPYGTGCAPGMTPVTQPAPVPGLPIQGPVVQPAPVPQFPVVLPAPEPPASTTPCPESFPLPPKEEPALIIGHMEEKKPFELTWAHDDDDVEVRWLMSPMLKDKLGSTAAFFGLFHIGIGFHNTRTALDTVIVFQAKKFGLNLFIPEVDHGANKINWDTAAEIVTSEGQLDTGYWVKRSRVATIKGTHYNKLLKWVPSAADKYTNYFLFNLAPLGQQLQQPHLPAEDSSKDWPAGGVTCSDVAQAVLNQVGEIAGQGVFNADCSDVSRWDAYLWAKPGTKPRKLDMSPGSQDFEQAVKFYEAFRAALDRFGNAESYPIKKLGRDAMAAFKEHSLSYGIYVDAHWDYWSYDVAERYIGARKAEARHYPDAPL